LREREVEKGDRNGETGQREVERGDRNGETGQREGEMDRGEKDKNSPPCHCSDEYSDRMRFR